MNFAKELEILIEDFSMWRRSKKYPTSKIPDPLFRRALDLHFKSPGLNVKTHCHIPGERWERAIKNHRREEKASNLQFIQLPPAAEKLERGFSRENFIVELELPSGVKLRLR